MELEHSFTVPVPPEQAWQVLLDVEKVAPCMPGATVDSVEGDVVKGRIKVKVGPVTLTYSGTARFIERDDQALSITLEASGKETRGSGTASAKVRSTLRDEDGQTRVVVYTTLSVTGRPAQFGRGVMAEVSGKIIQQFANNLAAQLAGTSAAGGQVSGNGAQTSTAGSADTPRPGQVPSPDAEAATAGAAALSIEELHLPVRAFNSLRRAGIHTLGDLSARSEDELLAIENLGPQSVREIRDKLAEYGTQLSTTKAGAAASASTAPASGAGVDGAGPSGAARTAPSATPVGNADSGVAAGSAAGPGSADATTPGAGPAGDAASSATANAQAHATAPGRTAKHAGPSAATAPPRSARPADQDVIDLLNVAGVPVLKRALPVVGGLAAVLFLLLRRRRGRHRRRAGA
jgi:carbon monoxide dehydrogenase subunit G